MTDDDRGFELSILNYSVHPLGHALDVIGRPRGGFTVAGEVNHDDSATGVRLL